MQEFIKRVEDFKGITCFNPSYKNRQSALLVDLEKLKANSKIDYDTYMQCLNVINRSNGVSEFKGNIWNLFNCVYDSESAGRLEYYDIIDSRVQRVHFYRILRQSRDLDFKFYFKELLSKLEGFKSINEDFWKYYYILILCIKYVKSNSECYKVIQSELNSVMEIITVACKEKQRLNSLNDTNIMDYFGNAVGSSDKVIIAKGLLVKEYLSNYQNDGLQNFFFSVLPSIWEEGSLDVSAFEELSYFRYELVEEKTLYDTQKMYYELLSLGVKYKLWFIDHEYVCEFMRDLRNEFYTIDDYSFYQFIIHSWMQQLSKSKLMMSTEEGVLREFECLTSRFEKGCFDSYDIDEINLIIKSRWKEVHENDSA
jgi:hypothetical protein